MKLLFVVTCSVCILSHVFPGSSRNNCMIFPHILCLCWMTKMYYVDVCCLSIALCSTFADPGTAPPDLCSWGEGISGAKLLIVETWREIFARNKMPDTSWFDWFDMISWCLMGISCDFRSDATSLKRVMQSAHQLAMKGRSQALRIKANWV